MTGRWTTTMQTKDGTIVLHAFLSGAWAITRGQVHIKAGDPFVMGSREGLQEGRDLDDAMRIAERHGSKFVTDENPNRSSQDVQGELF
jgi:hypothetical protein